MNRAVDLNEVLFEHRFWLQILGDHSRFILNELSPKGREEIETASRFIEIFDNLLEISRKKLPENEILELTKMSYENAQDIRVFKLNLIKNQLVSNIVIGLTPTFINHMVNEVEEYIRILNFALKGQSAPVSPIHYHLLWLLDGAGHATALTCGLDEVERKLIKKSREFNREFEGLYKRAVEMAGYMRSNIMKFPALSKLNKEAELEMKMFMAFLEEIRELRLNKEVVSGIMPLLPDHMYREECYYLTKLSYATNGQKTDCNGIFDRVE